MDVSAAPASRQASFPDGDNYPTKTNIFHLSQPTTCFVIFQALARYTRREATCLLLIVYISTTLKAFTIFFLNKLNSEHTSCLLYSHYTTSDKDYMCSGTSNFTTLLPAALVPAQRSLCNEDLKTLGSVVPSILSSIQITGFFQRLFTLGSQLPTIQTLLMDILPSR